MIEVPTVTIELDRPRKLAVTLGALRRIKNATGSTTPDLSEDDGLLYLGPYLWACLVDEDRDLSIGQLEDMIAPAMMPELLAKLRELSELSSPSGGGGAEGNGPRPADETPPARAAG